MKVDKKVQKEVEKLYKDLQGVLHFSGQSKNIDFYVSALTEYNPFNSVEEIEEWLKKLNSRQYFEIKQIPLTSLRKWNFNNETGDLEHISGGFFSIRGLKVRTNMGLIAEWSQPIIYQPEIGILGIVTKKINGILYFLVQAKAEPGNINTYQLSPTVQATRSNYTRLHGGKAIPYLKYFLGARRARVLIDQLQSEQGARFFCKRNRNIVVRLRDDEEIRLGPNFRWVTLAQLQRLAQRDNLVNMDTRSVISEINYGPEKVSSLDSVDSTKLKAVLERSVIVEKPVSVFGVKLMASSHINSKSRHTMEEVLRRITHEKCECIMERELVALNRVKQWKRTKDEIFHEKKKYFSIIGVRVRASSREVNSWDQPIIKQKDPGIVGFMAKEINGILHFLIQLKMESGVMDLLEIAPTVQLITDNYTPDDMPLYTDRFLDKKGVVIFDSFQSEEGGRFFRESNQNTMLLTRKNFVNKEPPLFIWVSLRQLKEFVKFNNFVNIEARSLLACLQMR